MKRRVTAAIAALALAGCVEGTDVSRRAGDALIDQQSWTAALAHYRTLLRRDPDDADSRRGYFETIERLEAKAIADARRLAAHGDLASAEGVLAQALLLVPESTLLREELARTQERKEARALYRDAVVAARAGRRDRGLEIVERALSKDPDYHAALSLLETLHAAEDRRERLHPIRLATGAPVTMNFRDASFKEAALALGRAYGVNMIFDAELADRPVSVYAEGVDFVQAFQLLLRSNGAFYRRLGANSVVIAQDNDAKRAEYEDYVVRTFFVRSGSAQTIADTLTRTLGLQQISVDEAENTITVRDAAERVVLADQIINANDRRAAEVLMEVEVLEVNRNKSERLGLDFGSQITVRPDRIAVADVFPIDDLDDGLSSSAVVLPATAFRYFKQDVDARILASPRIRAVNGRPAQFHVGDRVPLRSSEVVQDTGQTRTTFEYQDVGIRLDVVPEVRLNSSVAIDVALEVSSLGQNLGTTEDPAFVIGTRNVETRMELSDGETAIIGGLIRDEDRRSVDAVPGLGRVPLLGQMFRRKGGEGSRTDILLTITPRIVRPREMPSIAEAELYAGTGDRVTTENPHDFLEGPTRAGQAVIRLDLSGAPPPAAGRIPLPEARAEEPEPAAARAPSPEEATPTLSFSRASYDAEVGEVFDVALTAAGFAAEGAGTAVIRFRPDVVAALEVAPQINMPARIDNEAGQVVLELTPEVGGAAPREIAVIRFRAEAAGLSYLLFGGTTGVEGAEDLSPGVELRNSRIVVR